MSIGLWRKQSIQCASLLRTEGAIKKKRCVCNLLADRKHTSDSSLPIKIIVAKTKTINEIISSNINCAAILKDSDYLIRLVLT